MQPDTAASPPIFVYEKRHPTFLSTTARFQLPVREKNTSPWSGKKETVSFSFSERNNGIKNYIQ
jgi:hypothetical protein